MWTTEEQFMLACVVRAIDPQATLALGPVPIVGADETFKGGFVIRAEKCPNRRGAERVLAAVGGPQATFDQLMTRLGQPIRAVWLNGDYPEVPNAECQVPNDSADWLTVDQAKHLSADGLLVIASDLFPTAATAAAQMQWAGCSWAERGGTFVNVDGMVQQLSAAPVGPEFAVPAGDLLWRMLGQAGPVDLVELWRQMAEAGVGGYPPAPPGDVQCSPAPFAGNRSAPGVHQ
jgi:NADH-quinone oxidoreductase subunit G